MLNPNYLYASTLFYLVCKIISRLSSLFNNSMYNKSKPALTSIPENDESEEEIKSGSETKWVPKKKHEVLKAKYKCLKKLFQIYDASVIGILPESYAHGDGFPVEGRDGTRKSRRKKRSHRTRTDASAGTDASSELNDSKELLEKETATAVIRDLKLTCSNTLSAQTESKSKTGLARSKAPLVTPTVSAHECTCAQASDVHFQHHIPYLMMGEKRKLTRFQSFVQRLLGIRRERPATSFVFGGHVLAASDNNINQRYVERRKRRGLRFRRVRRPKKVQSDSALRDAAPALLGCAQAVQRTCLLDTTMRQCPFAGCRMICYGIINYNDHLNLCHFPERRHCCHYCHEGFELEDEKTRHENEHIGLTRLGPFLPAAAAPASRRSRTAITSNTQTDPELTKDVQDEKLKKIVSFFDKIVDSDQILSEIKKNGYSETNLRASKTETSDNCQSVTMSTDSDSKRMSSCVDMRRLQHCRSSGVVAPQLGSVKCNICGERFDYRRQLSMHLDLEHRAHGKFSRFHSCAGLAGPRPQLFTVAGKLDVTSIRSCGVEGCPSTVSQASSISCDPSTNIVYSSTESLSKRSSVLNNWVDKFKHGVSSYKWEPGTKIIRV